MKATRIYTRSIRERSIWRLADGREVFVKIDSSNDREAMREQRTIIERERTCLEVLEGLAVPTLVTLDRRLFSQARYGPVTTYLAQTVGGTRSLQDVRLRPEQIVGLWLFLVEQLAAFRRRGIIYTDIKPANVMVTRQPFGARLVDFGAAGPLVRGPHKLQNYGFTPGHESPEIRLGHRPSERSLVFEAGAFLFHQVTGQNVYQALAGTDHYGRAVEHLGRTGSEGLARLLESCLSFEPAGRPANYEHLLRRIKRAPLSDAVSAIWTALRAPYVERLSALGLSSR